MTFRIFLFIAVLSSTQVFGQEMLSPTRGTLSLRQTPANIQVLKSASTQQIISFRDIAQKSWRKIAADAQGQHLDFQLSYKILSFVGPYLSIQNSEYCDCGGAHPSAAVAFQAIDLSKSDASKQPSASLNDVFPEPGILAALEHDKVVAATLSALKIAPPSNLKELVDALKFQSFQVGECDFTFGENLLQNFSFYDVRDDKVAVRIGLPHGSEVCRGQITQLGILLPIPAALSSDLAAAKQKKAGLLMIDAGSRKEVEFDFNNEAKTASHKKKAVPTP